MDSTMNCKSILKNALESASCPNIILYGSEGVGKKHLLNEFEYLFGEDQGRFIIEIDKNNFKNVAEILENNSVHYDELGTVGKNELIINDKSKVTIDDLIKSHTNWLTNYMSK